VGLEMERWRATSGIMARLQTGSEAQCGDAPHGSVQWVGRKERSGAYRNSAVTLNGRIRRK